MSLIFRRIIVSHYLSFSRTDASFIISYTQEQEDPSLLKARTPFTISHLRTRTSSTITPFQEQDPSSSLLFKNKNILHHLSLSRTRFFPISHFQEQIPPSPSLISRTKPLTITPFQEQGHPSPSLSLTKSRTKSPFNILPLKNRYQWHQTHWWISLWTSDSTSRKIHLKSRRIRIIRVNPMVEFVFFYC